ncbi:hypothetical protein BFF78_14910 [Streptomyces fodineus]|uniref:Uncharacterized protein n=2 Tax=Streptomyces fodineus TaxID=1904616 RepID=A0A1D7Y9F1_9ACTN|nr:hypothetical protein BFF78_14910 [Streptomyces fodineus]
MGNPTRRHPVRLAVRTVVPGVLAAAGLVLAAVSAGAVGLASAAPGTVAPATYCHVLSCSHTLNPQPLPPRGDD